MACVVLLITKYLNESFSFSSSFDLHLIRSSVNFAGNGITTTIVTRNMRRDTLSHGAMDEWNGILYYKYFIPW
jgi:hypothetical protein